MRRVIYNQKGGVGKTTITCNLAAVNALQGRRTLVVDLDPQTNSTHYLLGAQADEIEQTLHDYFQEMLAFRLSRRPVSDFLHETPFPRLDILPAHREMEGLQEKLGSKYKIFKLREALDRLSEYDDVYIDTPPALNFYSRSALIAADAVLVPFDCDDFSRRALYRLLEDVAEIQEDHNQDLVVEGIVVNQFQARAGLPRRIVAELSTEGLPLMRSVLPATVKVRESHEQACPLVHLAPRHILAQRYEELWRELDGQTEPPATAVTEALRKMSEEGVSAPV